ncbi:uncharacterized protein FOBCDRAFT_262433 [Fusarium oxysporum Fo47]|nr:uncharacterized protein FOBCDRAFT_262433 [Fusarium oxysporum Fo47]QKD56581.1 hypothetical protein FOBCDRAFT_262433 [Fusarium oxysporum Fo47]
MARGVRNKAQLGTYYRTATGPRSVPLTDPQGHRPRWPIDIGGVHVYSRDAESVIFVPSSRFWIENEADDPDALWREDTEAFDCFKTSYAYNMIGQEHPRIVPVIGQDAWTGLPILKKPSYGSLWTFIQNYGSHVYTAQADAAPPTSRIKPEFRPLAYQWSLQLLSGLSLIHSRGIAYGELIETNCWISAGSLSMAVAGFLGSDFTDPSNGWNFPGSFFSGIEFSPEYLPLSRAGETERLMAEEDWMPDLEDEFMGKTVHKCWRFKYEDVEELQSEVQAFVEAHGWSIRGDELEGFDAHSIHRELKANFVPEDDE